MQPFVRTPIQAVMLQTIDIRFYRRVLVTWLLERLTRLLFLFRLILLALLGHDYHRYIQTQQFFILFLVKTFVKAYALYYAFSESRLYTHYLPD